MRSSYAGDDTTRSYDEENKDTSMIHTFKPATALSRQPDEKQSGATKKPEELSNHCGTHQVGNSVDARRKEPRPALTPAQQA